MFSSLLDRLLRSCCFPFLVVGRFSIFYRTLIHPFPHAIFNCTEHLSTFTQMVHTACIYHYYIFSILLIVLY